MQILWSGVHIKNPIKNSYQEYTEDMWYTWPNMGPIPPIWKNSHWIVSHLSLGSLERNLPSPFFSARYIRIAPLSMMLMGFPPAIQSHAVTQSLFHNCGRPEAITCTIARSKLEDYNQIYPFKLTLTTTQISVTFEFSNRNDVHLPCAVELKSSDTNSRSFG